ncbi:MAG: indole-3-glycerol phosphate synthase TrpC [Peptococcaceae bacterium]|nr:indole-3-glycerol phosphate synthase TrpC [Peptococcaceae bacterium]
MILDRIIAQKRREVDRIKRDNSLKSMAAAAGRLPPARSLARALKRPGRVTLLAEIKRSSPSRGVIRENFDPCEIARIYAENGADAISVLTDREFFGGGPEHLALVRKTAGLPLLRKDFIIDPVQVFQARLVGADAVLLICAILSPRKLGELIEAAGEAGLETLVEVHSDAELEMALTARAGIIGINNRDLRTFRTDLGTTLRLYERLRGSPAAVVSESGIKSAADMRLLHAAGVHAALVGEALMSSADMAGKVRELRYYQGVGTQNTELRAQNSELRTQNK